MHLVDNYLLCKQNAIPAKLAPQRPEYGPHAPTRRMAPTHFLHHGWYIHITRNAHSQMSTPSAAVVATHSMLSTPEYMVPGTISTLILMCFISFFNCLPHHQQLLVFFHPIFYGVLSSPSSFLSLVYTYLVYTRNSRNSDPGPHIASSPPPPVRALLSYRDTTSARSSLVDPRGAT